MATLDDDRYDEYFHGFIYLFTCLLSLLDSIDDEDEVLLVLAEELPNLSPYLGGSEYLPRLVVPLENLAAIEDATVRDKVSTRRGEEKSYQSTSLSL
jgi:hypothetical protein